MSWHKLQTGVTRGKLDNKAILVMGASSGFGKAITLACAGAGAKVALVARRWDALEEVSQIIQSNGGQALTCPTDVTDDEQIRATIATVIDNLGPIDVLVNNAGTNVTGRTIADTSADQWRQLLDVNLTSAFVCIHQSDHADDARTWRWSDCQLILTSRIKPQYRRRCCL